MAETKPKCIHCGVGDQDVPDHRGKSEDLKVCYSCHVDHLTKNIEHVIELIRALQA